MWSEKGKLWGLELKKTQNIITTTWHSMYTIFVFNSLYLLIVSVFVIRFLISMIDDFEKVDNLSQYLYVPHKNMWQNQSIGWGLEHVILFTFYMLSAIYKAAAVIRHACKPYMLNCYTTGFLTGSTPAFNTKTHNIW